MIKIEAVSLEEAYLQASFELKCSVTKLQTEVIQYPSKGILGVFKKNAIIVATKKTDEDNTIKEYINQELKEVQSKPTAASIPVKEKKEITQRVENIIKKVASIKKEKKESPEPKQEKEPSKKNKFFTMLNDTIMPASFVSTQDEEEIINKEHEEIVSKEESSYKEELENDLTDVAKTIKEEINTLFKLSCFDIDEINVSIYDENTLFIEFKGEDSALLIGKEGYRYKALSYMLFNWINSKYQLQLRLEIAEFLKNQEESISRYLVSVCESVDKDGRAQTKILDGVLVQIALKELRDTYPDKYVAIRSTRDGLKYIIINDYHSN
ncbi:spoIIIJ-associated protein [Epsilonproteobacteria bacterium SCGC AD-308-O04]|nr:spoIIIJ-associated protein [Epsilonproteobacteria bacterium SCGC AD-308-O04]